MLRELVPADLVRGQSPEDWKRVRKKKLSKTLTFFFSADIHFITHLLRCSPTWRNHNFTFLSFLWEKVSVCNEAVIFPGHHYVLQQRHRKDGRGCEGVIPQADLQVAHFWFSLLWGQGTTVSKCILFCTKKQKSNQLVVFQPHDVFNLSSFQQTTEPSFPEILLIAINKHGVNLIHPQNKVKWCLSLCFPL